MSSHRSFSPCQLRDCESFVINFFDYAVIILDLFSIPRKVSSLVLNQLMRIKVTLPSYVNQVFN